LHVFTKGNTWLDNRYNYVTAKPINRDSIKDACKNVRDE